MLAARDEFGILSLVSLAFFLGAVALCWLSGLPTEYTWDYPWLVLRRDVFGAEGFLAAALGVYLVGRLARPEPRALAVLVTTLRRWHGPSGRSELGRALGLAVGAALLDAVLFPEHAALDHAAAGAVGLLLAGSRPDAAVIRRALGWLVYGALVFTAVCYGYTVVKSLVLVDRAPWDARIVRFETLLVGVPWHRSLAAWAQSRPDFVAFCDWVYFRLFDHMVLTTLLLVGLGNLRERMEYLGALAICYVLGGPLYHLFPAQGPAYFEPESYAFLQNSAPLADWVERALSHNSWAIQTGQANRLETWGYVACMPSLHVAHECVMAWYARRPWPALAASLLFSALTIVSVLVLGWHYALDVVGGIGVAGLAIVLARRTGERLFPASLRSTSPALADPAILASAVQRALGGTAGALRRYAPGLASFGWQPSAAVVLGLVALGFGSLALWLAWPFTSDDAFSSWRYSTALLAGRGLRANVVDVLPNAGFSSLLAVLSGALGLSLGLPPLWWQKGLGVVLFAVTCWLTYRLARRWTGPLGAVVAVWALASYEAAIQWTVGGVETALLGLLAVGTALLVAALLDEEHGARPLGVEIGLGTLGLLSLFAGSQGMLVALTAVGGLAWSATRRVLTKGAMRGATAVGVVLTVAAFALSAWQRRYWGGGLTALRLCSEASMADPLASLRDFWATWIAWVLLGLFGLVGRREAAHLPLVVLPLLFALDSWGMDPTRVDAARHFLPVLPLVLVLAVTGIEHWAGALWPTRAHGAGWVCAGLGLVFAPRLSLGAVSTEAETHRAHALRRDELGRWLATALPREARIAFADTSMLGLASLAQTVDSPCLGIGDSAQDWVSRVLSTRPDAVVVPSRDRRERALVPCHDSWAALYQRPQFRRDYEFSAEFTAGDPRGYWVFVPRPRTSGQ